MIFYLIRAILFVPAPVALLIYLKSRKKKTKAGIVIPIILAAAYILSVSFVPFEKMIPFSTPEEAFRNCCRGTIEERFDGRGSCLIVSKNGDNVGKTLFEKRDRGYVLEGQLYRSLTDSKNIQDNVLNLFTDEKSGDLYAEWTLKTDKIPQIVTNVYGEELKAHQVIKLDGKYYCFLLDYVSGDVEEYGIIVDGVSLSFEE